MSPYLNIHSHTPARAGEVIPLSAGLHPWYLTPDWRAQLEAEQRRAEEWPEDALCVVGECGLDRLCATPYDMQLEAFDAQIQWSERLRRPLVLHCVRAVDDVLRMKRGTRQPWIFHGFRGKPQQLRQLLDHGFYVSFGFRYNVQSLRACPLDRLFLETDTEPRPIADLYTEVATLLSPLPAPYSPLPTPHPARPTPPPTLTPSSGRMPLPSTSPPVETKRATILTDNRSTKSFTL